MGFSACVGPWLKIIPIWQLEKVICRMGSAEVSALPCVCVRLAGGRSTAADHLTRAGHRQPGGEGQGSLREGVEGGAGSCYLLDAVSPPNSDGRQEHGPMLLLRGGWEVVAPGFECHWPLQRPYASSSGEVSECPPSMGCDGGRTRRSTHRGRRTTKGWLQTPPPEKKLLPF